VITFISGRSSGMKNQMRLRPTPLIFFSLAGLALAAASAAAGLAELDFAQWLWMVMLSAVGCGFLVVGAWWVWRRRETPRWWVWIVLGGGIAFRLLSMPAAHMMCDDAARYHWDGKLVTHGVNPWGHTPYAIELLEYRTDPLDERINHENVRTPYPPLAELLFAAGYLISPGRLLGYQITSLVAEIAAWLILLGFLDRRGRPKGALLLLAWMPLAITEGYLPGHVDLLGLPFQMLFLVAVLDGKPKTAGIALALAFTIKPLALVLAPAAVRELGWKKAAAMAGVAALVAGALYAPSLVTGKSHFGPMLQMARDWDSNGTVAALLDAALPREAARAAATALMGLAVLAATFLGRDFLSRACLAMAAVMAFSPVIFPWYVIWLIPLFALRPDPALIALAVLVPITNVVQIEHQAGGGWHQPPWSVTAAFVPFYLLAVAGYLRRWGMFSARARTWSGPSPQQPPTS
jgi:hypothetical protein